MKRLDMIHQISDNVLSSFFPNLSLQRTNLIADCILTECEKYGMLPPYNPPNLDYGSIRDCVWEPDEATDEEVCIVFGNTNEEK